MKRFALLLACAAVAFGAQATPQQDKMKACNAEAKTNGKKGDERKAFMKECLSGGAAASAPAAAPANAACEKSAADKKLHGAAATAHIKKCTADAAASAPK
ncbi:PsiF family protein [Roseateles sp. BYS78W]|uniref:PsiF family protein n=1 Tax=Pelomonas candidula TaxID=3299025 RepID=A0ABW7H9T5_9BURK